MKEVKLEFIETAAQSLAKELYSYSGGNRRVVIIVEGKNDESKGTDLESYCSVFYHPEESQSEPDIYVKLSPSVFLIDEENGAIWRGAGYIELAQQLHIEQFGERANVADPQIEEIVHVLEVERVLRQAQSKTDTTVAQCMKAFVLSQRQESVNLARYDKRLSGFVCALCVDTLSGGPLTLSAQAQEALKLVSTEVANCSDDELIRLAIDINRCLTREDDLVAMPHDDTSTSPSVPSLLDDSAEDFDYISVKRTSLDAEAELLTAEVQKSTGLSPMQRNDINELFRLIATERYWMWHSESNNDPPLRVMYRQNAREALNNLKKIREILGSTDGVDEFLLLGMSAGVERAVDAATKQMNGLQEKLDRLEMVCKDNFPDDKEDAQKLTICTDQLRGAIECANTFAILQSKLPNDKQEPILVNLNWLKENAIKLIVQAEGILVKQVGDCHCASRGSGYHYNNCTKHRPGGPGDKMCEGTRILVEISKGRTVLPPNVSATDVCWDDMPIDRTLPSGYVSELEDLSEEDCISFAQGIMFGKSAIWISSLCKKLANDCRDTEDRKRLCERMGRAVPKPHRSDETNRSMVKQLNLVTTLRNLAMKAARLSEEVRRGPEPESSERMWIP